MAKKARRVQRNNRKKTKRRSLFIFPYVIMALIIVGIPFSIYQLYVSSVDRTVRGLETAIKTYDSKYIEEKTDRLPIILDVFKSSYSDTSQEQDEFYKNNFKNLEIQVEDQEKKSHGKEVTLTINNVNYIDVYEKVDDSEDESKIHSDYMAALADPNQETNTREATILLTRTLSGYDISESRDFVNAILGGALEYAEDFDKENQDSSIEMTNPSNND